MYVCMYVCQSNNRGREVVNDEDNSNHQIHDNEEKIERLNDDSTLDKNKYDPIQWKNIITFEKFIDLKE